MPEKADPMSALRELEAKATPGPWHQYAVTGEYIKNASNGTVADLRRYKMGAADAAFIVAAVEYVRASLTPETPDREAEVARITELRRAMLVALADPDVGGLASQYPAIYNLAKAASALNAAMVGLRAPSPEPSE